MVSLGLDLCSSTGCSASRWRPMTTASAFATPASLVAQARVVMRWEDIARSCRSAQAGERCSISRLQTNHRLLPEIERFDRPGHLECAINSARRASTSDPTLDLSGPSSPLGLDGERGTQWPWQSNKVGSICRVFNQRNRQINRRVFEHNRNSLLTAGRPRPAPKNRKH